MVQVLDTFVHSSEFTKERRMYTAYKSGELFNYWKIEQCWANCPTKHFSFILSKAGIRGIIRLVDGKNNRISRMVIDSQIYLIFQVDRSF